MYRDRLNKLHFDRVEVEEIIKALQPELDILATSYSDSFKDTFAKTATIQGIMHWENILGITPNPSTEDEQFRRDRIINRLVSNIPFSEKMLQQIMDNIMGIGNWEYLLDYKNYYLEILSLKPGKLWLIEMRDTLEKILPANLIFELIMYYLNWQAVLNQYDTWGDIYNMNITWEEVMEGV